MPLLAAGNTAAKPRGVEAQAVEKIADDDVEAAKKTIERLKSRFKIETDEFTNRTTYMPKKEISYQWVPAKGLISPEIRDGDLFVRTLISEATYPDTITIKIGDTVTTYKSIIAKTTPVKEYYGLYGHQFILRYETIFAFPDDSLLRHIASHAKEINQDGISRRYLGENGKTTDYIIPDIPKNKRYWKWYIKHIKEMVEVIIETLELYDALQIVKRSEQQEIE
jgi:hypothetical protein